MSYERIAIVGAGAWGTALAQTLARHGKDVMIWAHEEATAREINETHANTAFLPGVHLARTIRATSDPADLAGRELCLLVAPAQHLRTVAAGLDGLFRPAAPYVICSKGIEQATGKLLGEVIGEVLPAATMAALSGPSFAIEVARGLPAALTVASTDEAVGREIALSLGSQEMRLYWTDDLTGVQIGGAIKNVLAIAAGIVEGRKLGANAHAALVTRGFAEMNRFARALGARPETMAGLAGLGDLLLTCGSPQSRNMSLGHQLGEGRSLAEIMGARRAVTEGVYTAAAMVRLAAEKNVDVPIARAVNDIVEGRIGVDEAIEDLMARPPKPEYGPTDRLNG
jgi:glycerol-3-phosphate dehydrogenase (NAD(P)+)